MGPQRFQVLPRERVVERDVAEIWWPCCASRIGNRVKILPQRHGSGPNILEEHFKFVVATPKRHYDVPKHLLHGFWLPQFSRHPVVSKASEDDRSFVEIIGLELIHRGPVNSFHW